MNFKQTVLLAVMASISSVIGQGCNTCNSNTKFACFSDRQYALCDANGAINLCNLMDCGGAGICDNTIANFPCSLTTAPSCPIPQLPTPAPATTVAPTTVAATTVPMTTVAPVNPTTFCLKEPQGRYPYGTNCKQYIYCYPNNGMKGAIYSCTGTTLFNKNSKLCEANFTCV